jgi:ferredoxin-NADP reductase
MVSGKNRGQWGDRMNAVKGSSTRMLLIDGPYTSSHIDVKSYDTLFLIAGGIGITPILSVLQDASLKGIRSIRLVWCIRNAKLKQYCSDVFKTYREKLPLKVSVHLTSKSGTDEEMQDLSDPEQLISGRPDWDKTFDEVYQDSNLPFNRVGVMVCGPHTLTHHVWDTCNSRSDDKVIFELFRETFKL